MATNAERPELPAENANVAERINWVMQQIDYIQKTDPSGDGLSYKIVTHDAVTELVRPYFVKAGLVYYPLGNTGQLTVEGNRTQFMFQVRIENMRNREDFIDVQTLGFGVDKQDKGPGKAISYGVKIALLKALGLATGEDPDLNQGSESDFRSTLDQRVSELEDAIEGSDDTLSLTTLMNSEPTRQIMAALQSRNAGEFARVRALMSDKSKKLKAKEKPATIDGEPAATTGAASGEDAGLGGST